MRDESFKATRARLIDGFKAEGASHRRAVQLTNAAIALMILLAGGITLAFPSQ